MKKQLFDETTDEIKDQTPVYKTWLNAWQYQDKGEINSGEVVTIPDQTMPVIEILKRFANGIPMGLNDGDVFEGEDSIVPPNWETMDLSERFDYMAEKAAEADKIVEDYQAWLTKLENEKLEKEIEERINSRKQQIEDIKFQEVKDDKKDK